MSTAPDTLPEDLPASGQVSMRAGQRNFFQGIKTRRVAAFKARRQYGKTTTFGKIAIFKMMKFRNHTVIFGSAKLSLATEIVRKQEGVFDEFGTRADVQREAALFQDLISASAGDVQKAGRMLTVADASRPGDAFNKPLSRDDFAELFEAKRLEFRIYHDRTSYSRTKVIALSPSAVGETGDMMADEIARIRNWREVYEAIEPIISSDPSFRLLLSTTPAPDDTHLAFEQLMEPPGLDLPVKPEGNWFTSEFGIEVLRLTAYDAHADGVMLYDSNTGEPVTPQEHRAKAKDDEAWRRNYGAEDVIGGTGAIGLVEMNAAQVRGEGKCLFVEVKQPNDIEEAIAWLETKLDVGTVGAGWDLATTTKVTSNPSSFTITERLGGVFIERVVCVWKTDDDLVQLRYAHALIEAVSRRPHGGRCRRLCIDSTNERLFARRMQRELGRLCTVELVVGSEKWPIEGDEGPVNYKTRLGVDYMQLFKDGQIDAPPSPYFKDDHRMVKREKGLFVCEPAPNGMHGDTFDSGKLSIHGITSTGGAITTVEGIVLSSDRPRPGARFRPRHLRTGVRA